MDFTTRPNIPEWCQLTGVLTPPCLNTPADIAKQIDSLKLGARLPKQTDMEGMARALVRLHDTYDLDLDRLAEGDMLGVQTAASKFNSFMPDKYRVGLREQKNRQIKTHSGELLFFLLCFW